MFVYLYLKNKQNNKKVYNIKMNQNPTEKPSLVSKNLAFGEKLIYRCKVHKGVWILPLVGMMGCYAFTLTYPNSESISSAWIFFALFFIFFLYTLWLYNGTDRVDRTDYYEDPYTIQYEKTNFMRSVFAFYLDMVKVIIIDKNGLVFSIIDYIGAYNYKQLYKLYLAECEKHENNSF